LSPIFSKKRKYTLEWVALSLQFGRAARSILTIHAIVPEQLTEDAWSESTFWGVFISPETRAEKRHELKASFPRGACTYS
jgi:hypothetical protein